MDRDDSQDAANSRAAPRTNMYVGAVVEWDGASSPAKIRNMSAAGALVDIVHAPEAGSPVRLTRGSLAVEGTVAWSADRRCGISFNSLVTVRDWMSAPSNPEQSRIDETFAVLRAGAVPLQHARCRRDAGLYRIQVPISEHLAVDLDEICWLLETLGADLIDDPEAVRKHGDKLQHLDIAAQSLRTIADLLRPENVDRPELAARLQNLRISRSQALSS
ncbi:MAG TPA: PilZ domain-containing protein [Sphingomicrobium sp.]|nr:PilZ domain-containing protein [Sphingomicrobium sp.]